VNERKEYFEVSLPEIAQAVQDLHGTIEFTTVAEAGDDRESVALRRRQGGQGQVQSTAPPAYAAMAAM
jgi:hypothetical protein